MISVRHHTTYHICRRVNISARAAPAPPSPRTLRSAPRGRRRGQSAPDGPASTAMASRREPPSLVPLPEYPASERARRAGRCVSAAILWRVALAELVGSALLVLLTCLPECAEVRPPATHRALAAGLVVATLVQCFDHVSGAHFNPAVTLTAALWGRWGRARSGVMMAAQLVGASLGAGALRALQPDPRAALCVTEPAAGVGAARALAVEAVLGGVLALANCASWDARVASLKDSWPLRIGLIVAGLALAAGEVTGAAMNPARSFGPALAAGRWTHHWVYWLGPLAGSALGTAAYCAAWRPRPPRAPPTPAPAPARPAQPKGAAGGAV